MLGIEPKRFWSLTPRQWAAVVKQALAREERERINFGWLFTMWANANRSKDAQPFNVEHFMPIVYNRRNGDQPAYQSPQDQVAYMKYIAEIKYALLHREEFE